MCIYKLCVAISCYLLPVNIAKNHIDGHALPIGVGDSTCGGAVLSFVMGMEVGLRF